MARKNNLPDWLQDISNAKPNLADLDKDSSDNFIDAKTQRNKALRGHIAVIIVLAIVQLLFLYQPAWSVLKYLGPECQDCYAALFVGVCIGLLVCGLLGFDDPLKLTDSETIDTKEMLLFFVYMLVIIFIDDIASLQIASFIRASITPAAIVIFTYRTWLLWYYRDGLNSEK